MAAADVDAAQANFASARRPSLEAVDQLPARSVVA
jgi:hypothetical protein